MIASEKAKYKENNWDYLRQVNYEKLSKMNRNIFHIA